MKKWLLLTTIALWTSCKDVQPSNNTTTATEDSLTVDVPKPPENLAQFDADFASKYQLENWKELMEFKKGFESLHRLNPKGLTVFLKGLDNQTIRLLKSDFPETFDNEPIKSRLKVVRMEVMKCIYFAENRQNEALQKSLENLYQSYSIFINRLVTMGEEKTINVLDSLN
ncbi:MAG: hypothetical protein ACO3M9_06730 [Flavobacteriaceae bacterium]